MSRESDIAWAAGIFEGEGSIQILGDSVRLYVAMTDRDTVEKFHKITGAGAICIRQVRRTKPLHTWHCNCREDVERILFELRPWFGERRAARANEALAVIEQFHRTCYCGKHFLALRRERVYCGDTCATQARRVGLGLGAQAEMTYPTA